MEEPEQAHRYFIDVEGGGGDSRSITTLIAWRKCYSCRQSEGDESAISSDPKKHIKQIAKQCAETDDYLLQDTPLKEALFRVILAGGNEPMTPEQIGESLQSRWSMSAYARDLSPAVIGRLLDNSESYSIAPVPEPKVEEDE